MEQICRLDLCTGCAACANICSHQAIKMKTQGTLGHFKPQIDTKLCVDCGLCAKICPQNKKLKLKHPIEAYAVWSKDRDDYLTSTSGGAASVLSQFVLNQGGVVYGCAATKGEICHIRVSHLSDLVLLKGSKYVQSFISESCFRNIKNDLQKGLLVLFIGTPCQVAGVKSYLLKQYENLITVDIICHGVPSQKLFFDYLSMNGIMKNDVDRVIFRDVQGFGLSVYSVKKQIFYRRLHLNWYYVGFMRSAFYNDACYVCQYAKEERSSDITIGDFWGCGKLSLKEAHKEGLSLVMPNTTKGKALFEQCKSKLYHELRTVEEAINGNKQLRVASKRHFYHKFFSPIYRLTNFRLAAWMILFPDRLFYSLLYIFNKR